MLIFFPIFLKVSFSVFHFSSLACCFFCLFACFIYFFYIFCVTVLFFLLLHGINFPVLIHWFSFWHNLVYFQWQVSKWFMLVWWSFRGLAWYDEHINITLMLNCINRQSQSNLWLFLCTDFFVYFFCFLFFFFVLVSSCVWLCMFVCRVYYERGGFTYVEKKTFCLDYSSNYEL